MTKALERAFREVSKLSDEEQDALAESILAEILGDDEWERSFSESADVLEKLADEALEERRAGKTKPLEPDKR